MLIDTHAHLYWDSYKTDLGEVIQRSVDAGVTTVINIGVDVKLSQKALDQAGSLENIPNFKIYSTIAIHPEEANKYSDKDILKLEQIYRSAPDKVVAVGECGLDYFQNNNNNDYNYHNFYKKQVRLFEAQINLAKKLGLPLVVHCREAWDDIFKFIGDYPTVLHCYSGLLPTTNYVLQTTNLLVSFAANITYPKNEYLREAVKLLPLEKILLETDSPFLAPQSKRGQRNEPSSIKEIAETIAQIKGVSFEEVARQTTENAKRLFAL